MRDDLQKIYDQYVVYHGDFRNDFLTHCGPSVSPSLMSRLLPIDEFAVLWRHWHEQGSQAEWRIRFEQGYEVSTQAFSECIRAALTRADMYRDEQLSEAA